MIHLKTHQQSLTSSFCPLYVVSHKVLQTLFFYNITFFPFPPDQSPWFLSSYHSPDHLKLRLWQQSLSFCSDFPTKYYRWSGWNSRNLCLTVLEVKSSESRCKQNEFLLRAVNKSLFQAVSSDFLAIMLCSSLYTVFPLCMSVFTFPLLCCLMTSSWLYL